MVSKYLAAAGICGASVHSLRHTFSTHAVKRGCKLHVLTDAADLPLVMGVSAANVHDSQALQPLIQAIPAIRPRRGPRRRRSAKLRADKGYDYPHLRTWLRQRGITPHIARRGIDTSNHDNRSLTHPMLSQPTVLAQKTRS